MGGCSFSRLRPKNSFKTKRPSVEYSNDVRRKSQAFDLRTGTTSLPRNCSITLIYSVEDELIRQIKSAADTLGHRVTSVQADYQAILDWNRQNKSSATPPVDTSAQQFAPKIHEQFGNEALLPLLELVIIDRRQPGFHSVADSICEYFRQQLTSGFDAIIVAILSSSKLQSKKARSMRISNKSCAPQEVLDSGLIQSGFSRLIYQSELATTLDICQELLIFQCHDIALLRRLRQVCNKYSAGSSAGRYGSNGHLSQLDSRGSAPHLSRVSSTGIQTPPTSAGNESSATPSPACLKSYVAKGRSASISGASIDSTPINPPALVSQNTVESLASNLSHGLMEPIVELDEKSQDQGQKDRDETGSTTPKVEPSSVGKMRRFSFDPSSLISSMTSKLGLSPSTNPRLSPQLEPTALRDWANTVLNERELKLKQCQAHRRAKRLSKLTGVGPPGEYLDKRKDSWARLNSFNIDSPLSQVVTLINSAQARSSSAVAKDLQRAMELMFCNDLFSGLLKTTSPNLDQTTADLIGGLITNLKREDKEATRNSTSGKHRDRPTLIDVSTVPAEIATCLRNEDSWNYDVLALERVTEKKPLVYLAMRVFRRFNVMEFLHCSEQDMANWLQVIEEHYRPSNPYHNSTHAADVMQTASVLLLKENIREVLDPIDEVAVLLAAVIHDVDHPGRTNPFLVNSGHELAILYNDLAVLESHHSALAFQLSKDDKINIFKNLASEDYRNIRKQIIDLVLATEMARHFEHVTKFVNNLSKPMMLKDDELSVQSGGVPKRSSIGSTSSESTMDDSISGGAGKPATLGSLIEESPENRLILKRMLIKCCDVNNPTRPLDLCKEWAQRIAEEYFAQTDDEKRLGLPLVMPTFDRNTCNIAKSQTSFIDFFLKDMFAAWDVVCECPEILANLESNYKYWNGLMPTSSPSKQ